MASSASASGETPGYEGDATGVLLGFDGQVTDRLSLGIVGFGANIDVRANTGFANRSTAEVRGVNLCGAYTRGAWQVRSTLGYSDHSYSSRRTNAAGTQYRRASGSSDGNRIGSYTEGTYTFKSGGLSVQPLLAIQFGWMDRDAFTQQGLFADGQGLNVDGKSQFTWDTFGAGMRFVW